MNTMHEHEAELLLDRISTRAYQGHISRDDIPTLTQVDNAIQFALEDMRDREGAWPSLHRPEVWIEVEAEAISYLGFDYDEIFEVAP